MGRQSSLEYRNKRASEKLSMNKIPGMIWLYIDRLPPRFCGLLPVCVVLEIPEPDKTGFTTLINMRKVTYQQTSYRQLYKKCK